MQFAGHLQKSVGKRSVRGPVKVPFYFYVLEYKKGAKKRGHGIVGLKFIMRLEGFICYTTYEKPRTVIFITFTRNVLRYKRLSDFIWVIKDLNGRNGGNQNNLLKAPKNNRFVYIKTFRVTYWVLFSLLLQPFSFFCVCFLSQQLVGFRPSCW